MPEAKTKILNGQEIEGWSDPSTSLRADGIRLLNKWGFFDCPDSRLNPYRWLRPIESLYRTLRIYHFQLSEAIG